MLATDMHMRSLDRPLQDAPETFERVHVRVAAGVLLRAVIDRAVIITKSRQDFVRRVFVGTDPRSLRHLSRDLGDKGVARGVGYDLGVKLALAFQDTEHDRLARRARACPAASRRYRSHRPQRARSTAARHPMPPCNP